MEPWWEFVVQHEAELRRMCRRAVKQRLDLEEDLYSAVVIDRAESIYNTYDPDHPSGAPLKTHMFINMRLYAHKWMATQGRPRAARFDVQLSDGHDVRTEENADLAEREWVEVLLSRLDVYHQRIVRLYHWEGLTFQEIAHRLGYSAKGTARNHYIEALEQIVEVLERLN